MSEYIKVKLGDLIEERNERCSDPQESGYERFVGLEHMDTGRLEVKRYGSTDDVTTSCKLCHKGDMLFGRRNPYLRRAGVINFDSTCSGDIIVFRPSSDRIVPEYIPIVLATKQFWTAAMTDQGGTMSKRVHFEDFSQYEFDLPDLDTQRKLSELIWSYEKLICDCEEQLQNLDLLVKSRFIEMFGTLADPKYGLVKVADLVSKDIEKVSKKYDSEDIIDYIDISSINKESRSIMDTVEYAIKDAPSRAQQCVIKGDILLSNVRPNLKTLAIVNSKKNNLVCSSGFTVLRCTDSCPEYLTIAITDDYFTDKLVKKANGSNYPAVTSKDVYNSVVPSASIELQKQFAEFVQQVDKSKFKLQQYLDYLKAMQISVINGPKVNP